ncbi:arginine-glutamic acid dipeptide repeats protein-like isoform X2 [Oreochromis niloticus]|uniref:arginine-glutamic acid dipeptide repeats protein-like isoform X2 n=1 Tax=Oreochromis niloticus TaxID=8128 RepID=UPI000DF32537|nr:arginine-glutamic acid dipeptide repeats protein-like isoform X2 [Oreochromis niloticus]
MRTKGNRSHTATQHTGPQVHTCKRVPLPRLHTIRAPLTCAQEATAPTPQPHILGPYCTRARGCHSHASTQSGPLSHVHKRPQFPRHNPTFWAPTVRMQEGATPTPPHNPGPSHMRTRGNRSHTATNILDPNCTRARGCHSHASTQSGPLSHVHKRPQLPRRSHATSPHSGPLLYACKRVPLPRLHTIRAPLTCAQKETAPTLPPNILDPKCTRARGCHSHASTQSGPLSHVHKRPQLPRRSHATSPHSGPLLYACKRVPLPRLHTIRAPLTCAQEETAPTPPPTYWTPTAHVQEGATPTPPHNPGPSHAHTRGHQSHAVPHSGL